MKRALFLIAFVCVAASALEAGSIVGKVTGPGSVPLSGIDVTAWRSNTFLWTGTGTHTLSDGTYTFTGLASGSYRIEFSDDANDVYAREIYDNCTLLSQGSNFIVTASSVHSNINATLTMGSVIAGRAFAPDGVTGASNIDVWAYVYEGALGWTRVGEFGHTDNSGAYAIGGLAAGSYRVEFHDPHQGNYILQVYSNTSTLATGTDVVVPASTTVSGINARLAQAGKISGRVLTTNGVPMSNGAVDVLVWNGSIWAHVTASLGFPDTDGRYTVGGLSSGTYRVSFNTWNDNILDEVYDDALEAEYGKSVAVVAGTTVSNINATLDRPAWPPRIIRYSVDDYSAMVYYTATSRAVCVLQAVNTPGDTWTDIATNSFTLKGVNTTWEFMPMPNTRFWRIRSGTDP